MNTINNSTDNLMPDDISEDKKEKAKEYRNFNKDKIRDYMKQYRESNKGSIKDQRKKYRESNKEKIREYMKDYRQSNKEKIREYKKSQYQINKDKNRERSKAYYEVNKGKIRDQRKEYYDDNKDKLRDQKRKYYQKNKDKIRDQVKKYVDSNKDKIKSYKKEWYQQNKDRIKQGRDISLTDSGTVTVKKVRQNKDIIREKVRKIKADNLRKSPKMPKAVVLPTPNVKRLSLMEEIQLIHKMRKGMDVSCPNCINTLEYKINQRDEVVADCNCGYKLNTRFS